MSADWKAGDRALCVVDSWIDAESRDVNAMPKKGTIYIVEDVRAARGFFGVALRLCGIRAYNIQKRFFFFNCRCDESYWNADGFRKIVPACSRAEISESISQPETR